MDEERALILEGKYDSLREFVVTACTNFSERLVKLEQAANVKERIDRHENSLVGIGKRLNELESFKSKCEESDLFDEGIVECSTPKERRMESSPSCSLESQASSECSEFKTPPSTNSRPDLFRRKTPVPHPIPDKISDLDPKTQQDLKNLKINTTIDVKCKLTEAQNAWLLLWYTKKRANNKNITGKQPDVVEMSADAVANKIWYASWKPDNIKNSFRDYLGERLRALRRKEEARKESDVLEANLPNDLLSVFD